MNKQVLKAYLGKIFFEFMLHEKSKDTLIILEGFPSKESHKEEIQFFYKKGFNVIWPHYPGTFQSKGRFLDKNIVKPINNSPGINVIDTRYIKNWFTNTLDIHPFKYLRIVEQQVIPGLI